MAKLVKVKLRDLSLRGETVHTRWGHVSFDRDGMSELELPEDEVQMLRNIKPFSWLADDHVPPKRAPEPAEPEPAAPLGVNVPGTPPPAPLPGEVMHQKPQPPTEEQDADKEPDALGEPPASPKTSFDQSDVTPPQGTKKRRGG